MRESRSFYVPLELRADGDGRTVGGLVVPYDSPAEIRERSGSYMESFRPGSFAKSLAERGTKIKLWAEHAHDRFPIGRSRNLLETRSGVQGEFYISRTAAGDDALELIRDGTVDSFSVGFEPIIDEWSRDRSSVARVEARLWEVSLTGIPVYQDALVSSLRSDGDPEESEDEEVSAEPEGDEPDEEADDSRARRQEWFTRTTAGFAAHLSRLERSEQ